jgi:hypothetical protein
MSMTGEDIGLPFSPFNAVIRDGIDHLMNVITRDSFALVLHGESIESGLVFTDDPCVLAIKPAPDCI